jgi:heme O synthase-like polyprenyltransferase
MDIKTDKMGVLIIMSHLIITLVILAIYGFTLHTGQADETLKTILTVIIGYWFGSMGASAIRKSNDKPNDDSKQSEDSVKK